MVRVRMGPQQLKKAEFIEILFTTTCYSTPTINSIQQQAPKQQIVLNYIHSPAPFVYNSKPVREI